MDIFRHSIPRRELALAVVVVSTVLAVGWHSLRTVEQALEAQLAAELQVSVREHASSVSRWLSHRSRIVESWAADTRVEAEAARLLHEPSPAALGRLRELIGPAVLSDGFVDFVLTDQASGVTVASLLDDPIGHRTLAPCGELAGPVCLPFVSDENLPDAAQRFAPGRTTMFVTAPVHGPGGEVVARLSFRLDPEAGFQRLFPPGLLAFDSQGWLLSGPVRHRLASPDGSPMRFVAAAAEGGDGVSLDPVKDHRDVAVVAAWTPVTGQGFGIALTRDAAEAFQPLVRIQRQFLALLALLIVSSGAVLLLDTRRRRVAARLAAILEASPLCLFVTNVRGESVHINRRCEGI
ncbi:MAG: cache domain-containing protein, partial [Bryobacteraceae bacterium]